MNDITKTEFFNLMNENSQEVTNEEIFNAYGKLITHIDTISNENDLASIVRKLNITRIEIVFLSKQIRYGQEKNAHKLRYIDKALSYLDSELSLIRLRIEHPEQFQKNGQSSFKSEFYIIPKSNDLGIIGMAEIVVGSLYVAKDSR